MELVPIIYYILLITITLLILLIFSSYILSRIKKVEVEKTIKNEVARARLSSGQRRIKKVVRRKTISQSDERTFHETIYPRAKTITKESSPKKKESNISNEFKYRHQTVGNNSSTSTGNGRYTILNSNISESGNEEYYPPVFESGSFSKSRSIIN